MKIVMETKNNTAAPSGSIKTPILNQVSPVGNHLIESAKPLKCSVFIALKNTTILPAKESAAAPTPIV